MASRQRTQRTFEVPKIVTDPKTSKSYRREERLGRGTFGQCFKMTDLDSGETYAVKVIPLKYVPEQRAGKEVEILKRMQHRHVVGISHSFEDQDYIYIFTELCRRQTLREILKTRGTLTNPEVRYYMQQLFSGLKYIHEQGYVHRDIKLVNVFINESMEPKIGDFGLATKQDPRDITLCGTLHYLAPEVWRKQGHGPESDVWAMGCVMYQLLVGKPPFNGRDLRDIAASILRGKLTLPRNVPKTARKLMKKIFQNNPQDRPTLDQILQHKFFTEGLTPEELPASSCDTVPQFESINSRVQVAQPAEAPRIKQVERRPPIVQPKEESAKSPCLDWSQWLTRRYTIHWVSNNKSFTIAVDEFGKSAWRYKKARMKWNSLTVPLPRSSLLAHQQPLR